MAYINKTRTLNIAFGLPLYTVPAGKEAVVHAIYMTPMVDTQTWVTLKAGAVGSTGHIGREIPAVKGGAPFWPKPVNLATGEIIEAACLADGDIEAFLSILEKDLPTP